MKSAMTYLVIMLILVALSIGASRILFSDSASTAHLAMQSVETFAQHPEILADKSSVGAPKPQSKSIYSSTSKSEINSLNSIESIHSPAMAVATDAGSEHSYETELPVEKATQDNIDKPRTNDTKETLDATVIGRAIPISASLEDKCKTLGKNGDKFNDLFCRDIFKLTAVMAQEPRDLSSAQTLEARLRNYVQGDNSKDFTVRFVECRKSLCALEVSSLVGFFNREYSDPATQKFFYPYFFGSRYNPLRAYETNQNGERIMVTYMVYERR